LRQRFIIYEPLILQISILPKDTDLLK